MSNSFVTPMGCSPPGSSVHGISKARILEWVAIPFSRGSSQARDWTQVSVIGRQIFYHWTTRKPLWSIYYITKRLLSVKELQSYWGKKWQYIYCMGNVGPQEGWGYHFLCLPLLTPSPNIPEIISQLDIPRVALSGGRGVGTVRLYADKCGHFKEGDLGVGVGPQRRLSLRSSMVWTWWLVNHPPSSSEPLPIFPSPYLSLCLELSLGAEISTLGSQWA